MEIGIGLPATIPGVEGEHVLGWARRAEARGFSSLGAIDRIVYPNYESLIALAAAAAVTERIRLATTILIAPYRANGALSPSRPPRCTTSRVVASSSGSPSALATTTTRRRASTALK